MPATVWVAVDRHVGMVIYRRQVPELEEHVFVAVWPASSSIASSSPRRRGRDARRCSPSCGALATCVKGPDGFLYLAVDANPNGAILRSRGAGAGGDDVAAIDRAARAFFELFPLVFMIAAGSSRSCCSR